MQDLSKDHLRGNKSRLRLIVVRSFVRLRLSGKSDNDQGRNMGWIVPILPALSALCRVYQAVDGDKTTAVSNPHCSFFQITTDLDGLVSVLLVKHPLPHHSLRFLSIALPAARELQSLGLV